ncbi:MAG: hypothetical protein AAFV59_13275 [Pseudomonadota bacterium]
MGRSTAMWIVRICLISIAIALFSTTLTSAWLDLKSLMYRHADKVGHLIGMFFVTSISLLAFPKARAVSVFVGAIVLAGIIELAQLFGPRSADIIDLYTSIAGVLMAAIVFYAPEIRKWMLGKPR